MNQSNQEAEAMRLSQQFGDDLEALVRRHVKAMALQYPTLADTEIGWRALIGPLLDMSVAVAASVLPDQQDQGAIVALFRGKLAHRTGVMARHVQQEAGHG
jgi:hypothetical protein